MAKQLLILAVFIIVAIVLFNTILGFFLSLKFIAGFLTGAIGVAMVASSEKEPKKAKKKKAKK